MKNLNRRKFLQTTASAAAGSFVLPRFSIGASGANAKLNVAHIGSGGIAQMALGPSSAENIVAMCDIDSTRLGQYAEKFPVIDKVPHFTDFRVMLDKMGSDIDAVCVNTPDHTHFVATMDAMQRGKHVFTQKPLTHNIWQARTLKMAKEKYGVMTVMGNQGHTYDGIRQLREWYEADILGQVSEVHTWNGGPGYGGKYFRKPDVFPPPAMDVPDHIDWDLWKGPVVTDLPYNDLFHPLTWRGYYQFGSGILGDWFPHIGDGPAWILDLFNPVSVELLDQAEAPQDVAADWSVVKWQFEKRDTKEPVTLYWHNGGKKPETPKEWSWGEFPGAGSLWHGSKNDVFLDNRSNNPRLTSKEAMVAFKEKGYPAEKYERVEGGPIAEWIRACKDEGPEPGANFDYASPFTETTQLGVMAMRFGGKIEWNAETMEVTNRPELQPYVKEPVREGWAYGDDLWT